MTDHFEEAKDRILRESKSNGGITVDHLFDALIATNADLDEQHGQTLLWHEQVIAMVQEHFKDAEVRDKRIALLEEYAEETRATCADKLRQLIHEEHELRHSGHMQEFHSADATFQARLVWFFASTAGKIVLVVIGLLAGILLNYIFFGRP